MRSLRCQKLYQNLLRVPKNIQKDNLFLNTGFALTMVSILLMEQHYILPRIPPLRQTGGSSTTKVEDQIPSQFWQATENSSIRERQFPICMEALVSPSHIKISR